MMTDLEYIRTMVPRDVRSDLLVKLFLMQAMDKKSARVILYPKPVKKELLKDKRIKKVKDKFYLTKTGRFIAFSEYLIRVEEYKSRGLCII